MKCKICEKPINKLGIKFCSIGCFKVYLDSDKFDKKLSKVLSIIPPKKSNESTNI